MGAEYQHLTPAERVKIETCQLANMPVTTRARTRSRHRSTVFRELQRLL
ncbi:MULTISPECIES: helix-turn-helix domain-containing protein [unclassified Pseudovibrio]